MLFPRRDQLKIHEATPFRGQFAAAYNLAAGNLRLRHSTSLLLYSIAATNNGLVDRAALGGDAAGQSAGPGLMLNPLLGALLSGSKAAISPPVSRVRGQTVLYFCIKPT